LIIDPAIEVGGFFVENSKWVSVHLGRAEKGGNFNSTLYFSVWLCLSMRWFRFNYLCFDMDGYFSENHIYYKNRILIMRAL
jgi:hypothetical protein